MDAADAGALDVASAVRAVDLAGWPEGYIYGATRYADVILKQSFPERFRDLVTALDDFSPSLDELRAGGGGRTIFVKRFDDTLAAMRGAGGERIWGKQTVTIEKLVSLDGTELARGRTRGHEIDMFGKGTSEEPIPGVAVEMEWNNKDPFYDRDLISFQALHREGAIAIGVIVTRGPKLQDLISSTVRSKDGHLKFGQSSTHWSKLIPKVNVGGGGECPLLLVGIQPERIDGVELAERVKLLLDQAEATQRAWRDVPGATAASARAEARKMREQARDLMPPVKELSDPGAAE